MRRRPASAAELVEKQQRAAGEHAEQCDAHGHCQIHAQTPSLDWNVQCNEK